MARGPETSGRPKRDLTLWILVGLVAVGLVAAGVTWAWASSALVAPSAPTRGGIDDLTFTVSTDKAAYAPGEEVHVITNLTNVGQAPVRLSHGDSCGSRASFSDVNDTVWFVTGWNELCLQFIVEFTISPGQSIVSSFVWGQQDFADQQVPAGRYRASSSGAYVEDDQKAVFAYSPWFVILAES